MNESLLNTMALDMDISPYYNESDASFIYRVCYSALGLWCLSSSMSSIKGGNGITKHNQTRIINDILLKYKEIFPCIDKRLISSSTNNNNFSINFSNFIRTVYEETGYLNNNTPYISKLVNYGRCIPLGKFALFFGIPRDITSVNGLGIFSIPTEYKISIKDFLRRDDLSVEDYIDICYDDIHFIGAMPINTDGIAYFDPLSQRSPSKSWISELSVDYTLARDRYKFYYFVKKKEQQIYFSNFFRKENDKSYSFIAKEYRRHLYALKYYYKKPLHCVIRKLDDYYSIMNIYGHLPNREYYLLLLLSWPMDNFEKKNKFLIKNDHLLPIIEVLNRIGIEIKGDMI
jgi:hypothetical protein